MRRRALPFLLLIALVVAGAALSDRAFELRNRGIAQLENERPGEAEEIFRLLARLTPGEPLALANLAIATLRQQKSEEARIAIDKALALAPKDGELLALKGEILKWAGQPEEALTWFKRAAAAAPENLEVVNALHAHASTMGGDEAARAASQALVQLGRLRPDNLVVMLRLGQAAVGRGDRAAATQAYLRVRELLWQAPPISGRAIDQLLTALEGEDVSKARVPALRLENVLKVTPMYQQSQRELTAGILGNPRLRFAGEPPPTHFGEPLPVTFTASLLSESPTVAGGLAIGDFDGDQRPDIVRSAATLEIRLASAGPGKPHRLSEAGGDPGRLLAVDLDNDGALDLLTFRDTDKGLAGWAGSIGADAESAPLALSQALGVEGLRGGAAATVFDFDVEGDLDLVVAGQRGGKGFVELYRNALDGSLEAVGEKVFPRLDLGTVHAILASDLDRDGDLDLLLAHSKGLTFLDNLRQGRFADRTTEIGLKEAGATQAVASADLDNDGWPELITGAAQLKVWCNRRGHFEHKAGDLYLATGSKLAAVVAFDADNDGRLDLAAAGSDGLHLLAQGSGGRFDRTLKVTGITGAALTSLAAADLDGDGDLDLVAGGPGGLFQFTNQGGNKNGWLEVHLRGLAKGNSKNNLFGVGSVVEVRAGSAYQFREARGDGVHFGLGSRSTADSLRVVWTNGVPQQRLQPKSHQTIVEEQVLKGSCPFLYAWNGQQMAFVTDLLWNAPLGLPVAPGVWAAADPRELVHAPAARAEEGVYRLRVTEELWEAAFFDQTRLWVVDYPAELEVASNLKVVPGALSDPANLAPERVLASRHVQPVVAAWDGTGQEVTAQVARRDGVYADGYTASRYQGVAAAPWSFTFDLGSAFTSDSARPVRLLLDGWIFPADASLNLAVAQRSDLPYLAPRLEVETAQGWQTLMAEMGHPAGKTKTMVVDTPPLPAGSHRLRMVTSLWLHWDRIAFSTETVDQAPMVVAKLLPSLADLHFGGYSALTRNAPNAPHGFNYAVRTESAPWLPFPGRYTRYGDVRELLLEADDRNVILASGDELSLEFDGSRLRPPPPGWLRTVFLESFGWDKDADRNTWQAAQVEPLPLAAIGGCAPVFGKSATRENSPQASELDAYRHLWLTRDPTGSP